MNRPAPAARRALFEATELLSAKGTNSREVVEYVKNNSPSVILEDQSMLIDLGLMVLAGRVATVKIVDDRQLDIFGGGAPNKFMKVGRHRVQTKNVTLEQWQAQKPKKPAEGNRAKSHSELVSGYFEEMAALKLPVGTTLGEYLATR